jgi:hypothetical protein
MECPLGLHELKTLQSSGKETNTVGIDRFSKGQEYDVFAAN